MSTLEKLFRLEIDFHRRLRTQVTGTVDAGALHTSYALQCGYDPLIRATGNVSVPDVDRLANRLAPAVDARDLQAARDSLKRLLGIPHLSNWYRSITHMTAKPMEDWDDCLGAMS